MPSRVAPATRRPAGRVQAASDTSSGGTLAGAHARSGDRIAIASYRGSGKVFDSALVEFAELHADQNGSRG